MKDLKGVIFDMDGTIVNSFLDFDKMREDLGFKNDEPIIEAIEEISQETERDRLFQIVHKHELEGANKSELIDSFIPFLNYLLINNIKTALLTRNSKEVTDLTLKKFNLSFEHVITRDCDFPAKPSPEGLIHICKEWGIDSDTSIYVGDFAFDIECANNAEMNSILINWKKRKISLKADIEIESYNELLDDFPKLIKENMNLKFPM